MTPLTFGPAGRRLFGIFHAPATGLAPASAVLLCPPMGQELFRVQRFLRVLSDRLARAGVAVLRFDYHGTGDSPGDDEDGDMAGWQDDVAAAHAELRRRAGAVPVAWCGARLGATLAAAAAHAAAQGPQHLLMWDPVLDGGAYLRALREAHASVLIKSFCLPVSGLRRRLAAEPEAFAEGPLGYGMSETLRRQLRELAPYHVTLSPSHETTVMAMPCDMVAHAWAQALRAQDLPVGWVPFEHTWGWTEDQQRPGQATMVPAEPLQQLLQRLRAPAGAMHLTVDTTA